MFTTESWHACGSPKSRHRNRSEKTAPNDLRFVVDSSFENLEFSVSLLVDEAHKLCNGDCSSNSNPASAEIADICVIDGFHHDAYQSFNATKMSILGNYVRDSYILQSLGHFLW